MFSQRWKTWDYDVGTKYDKQNPRRIIDHIICNDRVEKYHYEGNSICYTQKNSKRILKHSLK